MVQKSHLRPSNARLVGTHRRLNRGWKNPLSKLRSTSSAKKHAIGVKEEQFHLWRCWVKNVRTRSLSSPAFLVHAPTRMDQTSFSILQPERDSPAVWHKCWQIIVE